MEKQLAIEQRVKSGAESMIKVYSGRKSRHHDRKLLSDAQQVLSDSRTKIEVLRMNIIKLKTALNSSESEGSKSKAGNMGPISQTPLARVEILRYRIDVESRLMQGARSIIKANPTDKKSMQSVRIWQRYNYVHGIATNFFMFQVSILVLLTKYGVHVHVVAMLHTYSHFVYMITFHFT